MNLLVIDGEMNSLPLAMRAQEAKHKVKVWLPPARQGLRNEIGDGLMEKVPDWHGHMKWADLIILTGNSNYQRELAPFFNQGFPIIGANRESAALELDREVGMQIIEAAGLDLPEYEKFDNYDKAISFVKQKGKPFVSKPWGGAADKNLSYVPKSADNLICRLERWKKEKLKPDFLLQEMVEGQEMAVGAWFGLGGFSRWVTENWEEKRFMNDGYGPQTGEQGTTLRYTKRSLLFDTVLKPLEPELHRRNYVGYVDVNCIIDKKKGIPWPLEITIRFGWPLFDIQMNLHEGDPVEWLRDLSDGRDTLECKTDIAVGVVLTLGDYPWGKWTMDQASNWPIRGLTTKLMDQVSLIQVKHGVAPTEIAGKISEQKTFVTAGEYVLTVTGTGATVNVARNNAYGIIEQIDWPVHQNLRTDIGCRLEKELPLLQKHGFASGMRYG